MRPPAPDQKSRTSGDAGLGKAKGRIYKKGNRKQSKNRISIRKKCRGKKVLAGKPRRSSRRSHIRSVNGRSISLAEIRRFWAEIVPEAADAAEPVEVAGKNFLLTLNPTRFPSLPAADDGQILLDVDKSLSVPVKALIQDEEPGFRIVSENPSAGRPFMRELLAAAGFYSVEEDYTVELGTDPKLTVIADYKIEPMPDSLLRNEAVLLNINRPSVPAVLKDLLLRDGFRIVESDSPAPAGNLQPRDLYLIASPEPGSIVDSILKALAIGSVPDKELEIYDGSANGVSLRVKADRYFEYRGEKVVVFIHDDDAVSRTLSKLLESTGYRVVMIDGEDDFRKISDKLLSRINIRWRYGKHTLWPLEGDSFTVWLTGIKVNTGRGGNRRTLYMTDITLDEAIQDLLRSRGGRVFISR